MYGINSSLTSEPIPKSKYDLDPFRYNNLEKYILLKPIQYDTPNSYGAVYLNNDGMNLSSFLH